MSTPTPAPAEFAFDPSNDLLLRLQRLLRIAPREGGGYVRRAVLLGLLAWLPLAIWAALRSRLLPGTVDEPLLAHYGLSVRGLVAVPAMILAEGSLAKVMAGLLHYLVRADIVPEAEQARFREAISRAARLRDNVIAWVVIAGLAVAGSITALAGPEGPDRLKWAVGPDGLGFGGWWAVWVAEGLFRLLLLAWLWRLFVLFRLFGRIAKLGLKLRPIHPDGVGGLGPVRRVTAALGPFAFALYATVAASVAHNIRHHGGHVADFKSLAVVTALVLAVLVIVPLLPFSGPLRRQKVRALLDYGALAGRHSNLVHARWIDGRPAGEEPLLSAPELGPVADMGALHRQAASLRPSLIGKETLIGALMPMALPLLVVASLEIPIKELLQRLLGALI